MYERYNALYLLVNKLALKKIITIFFLGIYLFNMVGYRGIFNFFERSISETLITQLDNGKYNDAELVELKIPYPMLYVNNWTDYQRYDGELEVQGIHYNYVKRKLSNDTLYLLCLPNREKTKLSAAKIDYLKNTNDIANPLGGKKSSSSNTGHKAFYWEHHNFTTSCSPAAPAVSLTTSYCSAQFKLHGAFILTPFQPPQI